MHSHRSSLSGFVASFCLVSTAFAAERTRYVVVLDPATTRAEAQVVIGSLGGELVQALDGLGVIIATSADTGFLDRARSAAEVAAVDLEPSLPAVTPDDASLSAPTTDDSLYSRQWNIRRARADETWKITTGSPLTKVAVVDLGIAANHPDLAPNLVAMKCFSIHPTCNPYPQQTHGTRVASVVAAAFGGGATVGVGPNLALGSFNVLEDDNYYWYSSIWRAMLEASAENYRVIVSALGSLADHRIQEDTATWVAHQRVTAEVTRRGSLFVFAAGNWGMSLNGPPEPVFASPLALAVGATGIRPLPEYPQEGSYDVPAFYTARGAVVDLVAPGGDCGPLYTGGTPFDATCDRRYALTLPTVFPNASCRATWSCPVGYGTGGGTSFAAPAVAGAAALMLDVNPRLTPSQVRSILLRTARRVGSRETFGHGLLDVAAAVEAAAAHP